MAKNQIRAFIKNPGGSLEIKTIDNTLENLQYLVGGYIETVTFLSNACLIVNEEGRLNGMPFNCTVCDAAMFGPVVFVGIDGEDFVDFPAETLKEFNALGLIRELR